MHAFALKSSCGLLLFALLNLWLPTAALAQSECSATADPAKYFCAPVEVSEWQWLVYPPYGLPSQGWFSSEGEAIAAVPPLFLTGSGPSNWCTMTPATVQYDSSASLSSAGIVYQRTHTAWYETTGFYSDGCIQTWGTPATLRQHRTINCPPPIEPGANWSLMNPPGGSGAYCAIPWTQVFKRCADGRCSDLMKGNPSDVMVGTKVQRESDYRGAGQYPISFVRTYDSNTAYRRYFGGNAQEVYSPLGTGWMATYFQSVRYVDSGTFHGVYLLRPDGSRAIFNEVSGQFVGQGDAIGKLTRLVDGQGQHVGWEYLTGSEETETYDAAGRLLTIRNRAGLTHTLSYSGYRYPSSVQDSFGRVLAFGYDNSTIKRLASLTLPDGSQVLFSYDANNNLATVTQADLTVRTYHYELPIYFQKNLLTGITDEAATRYATWGYDSDNRVSLSERAGGVERYTFSYSGGNRVVVDPLNQSRTYASTTAQGARRVSGSNILAGGSNEPKTVAYDTNGNVTSRKDFADNETRYTYDTTRNLETSRTEAYGTSSARTVTTAWHANYRLPTLITEPNRTTSFTHDTNGNVLTRTVTDTSVTPHVSRTWTYTYNSFGQVLTEDGPRTDVSDVTTLAYYTCTTGFECGQLHTVTNTLNHTTTYDSYNAHGQPTQITDANGVVTTLAYDLRQRLTDRCVAGYLPGCSGGELMHLDYLPTGLLERVTNPDGSFIEYQYDPAHRLTGIADGAGNQLIYTLDNMGNRLAEDTYDPGMNLKRTHTRVFNTLNQLWKDVNAAGTSNVTTIFGYDNNGNQATVNAPLGRNSSSLYDELNRLKQITDPDSGVTQFAYDSSDNLTSVTDPRSLTTSYAYSGFGDLLTQTSPDTGVTAHTYDSGGNLKTSTDARAAITTYDYDALNRVTSAAFKIGSTTDQTISYTYDAGTHGKGRLTGASDANHSMSWAYDGQGRVISKTQLVNVGTISKTIGYTYSANGQLASIQLPSGHAVQYGYDSNGQVTSVDVQGSVSATILNNIAYDPFGPVTGWTWGNGSTANRVFDTDGKLTSLSNSPTTVGNRTFGYDDAFRITATTATGTGAQNWTLGYDTLDRLNAATTTGTTIGYTYDANGNRLSQTGTNPSTYTMNGSSNRLDATSGALVRSYTYDAIGNTLTSGDVTFTYNHRGRMKSARATISSATTTYMYNALGQRMRKFGGTPGTVVFMYDEAGHLVGEYNATGALVQETVWLGDIPIATIRPLPAGGFDVFYVHTDQLNAPRRVTRRSNNGLRWSWDPTPFGEGMAVENPQSYGTFKYHLRFPGQYYDVESRMHYNYFRDYDPAVGRYVEADPAGLIGGINLFSYVGNNPLMGVDPRGLFQLGVQESWRYIQSFPAQEGGGQGGETLGSILNVKCTCTGSGSCWKLAECSATLDISVKILAGQPAEKDRYWRYAEGQHVSDLRNGMELIREWGGIREERLKKQPFTSRADCEQQSIAAMRSTLWRAVNTVARDSGARYDDSGRHYWHDHYYATPPSY